MHRRTSPSLHSAVTTLGFCGGIGSGKSTRLKHLVKWWDAQGAAKHPTIAFKTIDADIVGHRCYEPGSETYRKVVDHFSQYGGILASPSNEDAAPIDRKKLGAIVFASKDRMSELNHIVWPAIAAAIAKEIEVTAEAELSAATATPTQASVDSNQKSGDDDEKKQIAAGTAAGTAKPTHLVYAVEAAILPHMAEMLMMCDLVWMFHANEEAAVRRIMQRNGVTQEEAVKRVNAQSKMEEKVKLISDAKKELTVFDTSSVESEEELKLDLAKVVDKFEELLVKTEGK